jgi:threonine synthase
MSAYSARAGISCHVFIPSTAAENKLIQTLAYGAKIVKINGVTGNAVKMADEVSRRRGWPNVSTAAAYNPYALEGQKTAAYEIAEQLGWKAPDWVVIPFGSGNALAGQWAGFTDFFQLGLIRDRPRIAAVQAEGCAPFSDAVRRGLNISEVKPWENPQTIAGGVRDEYPYDIELALPAFRESNGSTVTVSDKEIVETMRLLSRDEGLFVEPTGAVASAGLKHFVEEKTIDKDETVVAMLTGSGLKDPGFLGKELPRPPVVDADISEVMKLVARP